DPGHAETPGGGRDDLAATLRRQRPWALAATAGGRRPATAAPPRRSRVRGPGRLVGSPPAAAPGDLRVDPNPAARRSGTHPGIPQHGRPGAPAPSVAPAAALLQPPGPPPRPGYPPVPPAGRS